MEEIVQAVAALHAGDPAARQRLLTIWEEWAERDAPLERCTIAHFLADTEEDPEVELEWDLRALYAATGTRAAEDRQAVDERVKSFLPSLHLNVGDAYRRLGDLDRAKRHAEIGLAHAHTLNDDGYGKTIVAGLERLSSRLATAS